MAKKPVVADASVRVRLKCVYSGYADNPGPGDVIEVEASEAERLIDLGAAEKAD